tara:strand:- start:947 stop:2020 length:1074 start_codon:yes stop_codon:yes gene_type:complete
MNIPREVQSFIRSLTPDDVGKDTVDTDMGKFVIHYEGFSDQCNYGHDDDQIHKIYQDVYRDFDERQEAKPVQRGHSYDDLGIDGNPVLYSIYKVEENAKTEMYQLIDSEISESRLFRFTASYNRLTGRDIADLLYLETLAVYMFALDSKQQDYGTAYARKTTQYGPYAAFRTSATDIYMLAFAVDNPNYKSLKLKNKERKVLDKLNFNNRQHYMFMNKIARYTPSRSDASSYLIRLEQQLQIKDAQFKQLRRLILDWPQLKYSQKQYIVSKLVQRIRLKGKGAEVFQHLMAMKTTRRYDNVNKEKPTSALKRAAATVGGAYVGSKIVPKLTKNKLGSKTGAGIGAIAGYWASGRKKV